MAKYTVFYAGERKVVDGIVKARATAYRMMIDGNHRHLEAHIVPGVRYSVDYKAKSTISVQPQGTYARPRDAIKAGYTFSLVKDGRVMYPFQEKRLDGTIKRRH